MTLHITPFSPKLNTRLVIWVENMAYEWVELESSIKITFLPIQVQRSTILQAFGLALRRWFRSFRGVGVAPVNVNHSTSGKRAVSVPHSNSTSNFIMLSLCAPIYQDTRPLVIKTRNDSNVHQRSPDLRRGSAMMSRCYISTR